MALRARWGKNDHSSIVSVASAAETLIVFCDVNSQHSANMWTVF
jgi:hypothetical protein